MVGRKTAGAASATKGGSNAGAEAEVEATAEGCEAGELGACGGMDWPVEVGEATDGCLLG